MNSDLMLRTASDTFSIILGYSVLCFFRYMPVYSIISSLIKAYLRILGLYWGIFWLIQTYSAPCVTLAYSQPCHILSPDIFRTGGLFKTLWNVDQANSEPCHVALFRHIQAYSEPCATFTYAKTWHNWIPGIFRILL